MLSRAEYDRVLRSGLRVSDGPLMLHLAPGASDRARLGLIVAKRVVPRAIDRNRIKRRARECFRRLRGDLPAMDVVLVARAGALALAGAAFAPAFAALIARAQRRLPPAP